MVKDKKRRAAKRAKKERWEIARGLAAERDGHRCQMCGNAVSGKSLNVHHILPASKKYEALYDCINNLITLCPRCHRLSPDSAHRGSFVFTLWLEKNKPIQYNYLKSYLENELKGGQQQNNNGNQRNTSTSSGDN